MRKIYIEIGNVFSKITSGLPDDVITEIKDSCSYEEKIRIGYKTDVKIHTLFNALNSEFPTGLYKRVCGVLKHFGYIPVIKDNRNRPEINIDKIMKKMEEFGLALRDYQIDGGISGLEQPCGLYNWSTGGGKTVLFIFLMIAYDLPTLILVNRKELMYQISSEISKITGRSVGIVGDGKWSPSKWTVGIVDTLNEGINSDSEGTKYRTLAFLDKIQMFVGDEIHHLGARTWKEIARACKNASVRFGFSGTCFHPDSEDIYLVAYTGEIISNVTSSKLIKDGWLAQPHIYMPHIECDPDLSKRGRDWHSTKKFLMRENESVNESGVKFIIKMYNQGITCIYFTGNDVDFGKKIHKMLLDGGVDYKDLKFMSGRESREVRKSALEDFKKQRLKIIGGTSIYDEGIDVPHTGAGANFGQGYSEISTRQRIGRVLRKTKDSNDIDINPDVKQIKYYWDPFNLGNDITVKHSEFRKDIYKSEEEFKVFEKEYKKKWKL